MADIAENNLIELLKEFESLIRNKIFLGIKLKARIESRFVDFWYYLWLVFVLAVFVDYIFTVAGNVNVIIGYG